METGELRWLGPFIYRSCPPCSMAGVPLEVPGALVALPGTSLEGARAGNVLPKHVNRRHYRVEHHFRIALLHIGERLLPVVAIHVHAAADGVALTNRVATFLIHVHTPCVW